MSRWVVDDCSRPPARPVVETAWRAGSDYDDGGMDVQQYRGQTIWFATQHGKASLVQTALKQIAGIEVRTRLADTDALGTFTGEIDRPGDALDTVVRKARLALSGATDLGLASEGSFFAHPFLPFVPTGIEMLAFVDAEHEIAAVQRTGLGPTNWSHLDVAVDGPLLVDPQWLTRIGFGDHSVCVLGLSALGSICGEPVKGLDEAGSLDAAVVELARREGVHTIRVMTDMRAHTNPTRQTVITELATSLAIRLTRGCPECKQAGWARIGVVPGIPCSWCGTPTERAKEWVFGCAACDHTLTRPAPGPTSVDPRECPHCNP
jgi:hypothetical protein